MKNFNEKIHVQRRFWGLGGTNSGKGPRINKDRTDFLTIRENVFLGLLKRFRVLKAVADEMQISRGRAQTIKANIMRKWNLAVNTNNRLLSMCKGDQPFKKLLYPTARQALPEAMSAQEMELEEEQLRPQGEMPEV